MLSCNSGAIASTSTQVACNAKAETKYTFRPRVILSSIAEEMDPTCLVHLKHAGDAIRAALEDVPETNGNKQNKHILILDGRSCVFLSKLTREEIA